MHRYVLYIAVLISSLFGYCQQVEIRTFYEQDSSTLKEIYYYNAKDSLLDGSYESFYNNGSLQTFGYYQSNTPDSTWAYYYENGRKKAEGKYRNGIRKGKWNFYFENGNLKSAGQLEGDIKVGNWEFYFETAGQKSTGNYFDDEKSGIWNYFYEDGTLKAQAYYEKGLGKYTEFYPSGGRKMEGLNKNDKSDGEWIYYFESGEVEAIGHYLAGQKEGVWEYFHKNGILAAQGTYEKGIRTGDWIYYHENGQKSQEGEIVQGKKDGYWKLFYPTGELAGEATFARGEGAKNEYYTSGNKKSEGKIVDGQKVGKWQFYSEKGLIEGEAFYNDGVGTYVGFYPDGRKKMEGKLKNDKRFGEWSLYNPDGSLAGTYRPIYEDETPIFKTREVENETSQSAYVKPDYKYKNTGIRYFQPKINEYRGVILASNPMFLLNNRLPIALEYYMEERMGVELQFDIIQDPFFSNNSVRDYELKENGLGVTLRQKFYSPATSFGMFYFGHQLSYQFIAEEVTHLDSTIVNAEVRRSGSFNQSSVSYGILIGDRWMKDYSGSGLTIDVFFGLSFNRLFYDRNYENAAIFDPYFSNRATENINFPFFFGLHIGIVRPKSKSKTQ